MTKTSATSRKLLAAIHGSFFISGMCCLIYEIVWQRVAVRLLGATVPSTVVVLCAFMVGLSIGAFLLSKKLRKIRRPLATYASFEIAVGICGIASVFLLQTDAISWLGDSITVVCGQTPSLRQGLRAAVVFLLLLVPTALVGATLPSLAHFSSTLRKELSAAALTTSLYATNTSGAVLGTLAAGFVLLPYLGIAKTLLLSASLNFVSSSIALICARHLERPSHEAKDLNKTIDNYDNGIFSTPALGVATALVFVSSALSMIMQVVWTRFFALMFGSSTYAFSTVAGVYIFGLALGAFSAPSIARSVKRLATGGSSLGAMGIVAAAIGLSVAATLFQYQAMPVLSLYVMKWLVFVLRGDAAMAIVVVSCALWLVLLPATLFGAMFPLAISSGVEEESETAAGSKDLDPHLPFGTTTSKLYVSSILGCVAGAICGGIFFSPVLSAWKYFDSMIATITAAVSLTYVLVAVMATSKFSRYGVGGTRQQLVSVAVLVIATTALIVTRPHWNQALMSAGFSFVAWSDLKADVPTLLDRMALKTEWQSQESDRILLYAEGENTTVTVVTSPANNLTYLKSNGKVEAAIPIDPIMPAVSSDLPTQTLLGLLPVLLHSSENKPLKVAAIGLGSGTTCGALARVPWVDKVTALEIEPATKDAERYFKPGNYEPFEPADGKVKVELKITDARDYLATTTETFDVIVSQPAEPWVSGASDLYTREFFSRAASKLAADGIFCQWVQLYSIGDKDLATVIGTFHSVFPGTTIWQPQGAGEILLIATKEKLKLRSELLGRKCDNPAVTRLLQRIGIHNQWELLANQRLAQAGIERDFPIGDLNSDDNLLLEYSLANATRNNLLEDKSNSLLVDLNNRIDAKELVSQLDSNGSASIATNSPNRLMLGLAHWERLLNSTYYASDVRYFPVLSPFLRESELPYYQKHAKGSDWTAQQLLPQSADASSVDTVRIRRLAIEGTVPDASTIAVARRLTPDIKYGADFLDDLGTVYLNSGDAEKAIACFSLASRTPNRSRSLSGLALAHWLAGDLSDENLSLLEQSLALDPNQFVARAALGQSLAFRGDYERSLPHLRAAAQIYPSSLPWKLVALVAVRQRNWSLANQNLRSIESKFGSDPDVLAMNFLVARGQNYDERARRVALSFYSSTKKELTIESANQLLQRLLDPPRPESVDKPFLTPNNR